MHAVHEHDGEREKRDLQHGPRQVDCCAQWDDEAGDGCGHPVFAGAFVGDGDGCGRRGGAQGGEVCGHHVFQAAERVFAHDGPGDAVLDDQHDE